MSEERTNMAIRDLKHYVIDYMSLDVQDDFEIICKYITSLQQKVEQLESIRKEAIEELSYMSTNAYIEDYDIREKHYNLLMNILNKGDNNVKDKK